MSLKDIKTYLDENNIDPREVERMLQVSTIEQTIEPLLDRLLEILPQHLPKQVIQVSNVDGPVTITVGDNNVVSVKDNNENKHRIVNLVELFHTARENIKSGDLYRTYSAVSAIHQASSKRGDVPPELEELLELIKVRIKEGLSPTEESKSVFLTLLESAYGKMMKV